MEPYAAGWLSIVPPIVAIALALLTKEVLSSLLIGILTGTLIYAIGTDANIIMGTLETTFKLMGDKVDFNILIFTSLLGALVYVVGMSGGTKAYGNWAVQRVKSRRATLMSTSGLGILIFIDDYFNCLSVGTVMRPLCDRYNVSRAKLAYIIDSTAAPVCILAPVSSWAAARALHLKAMLSLSPTWLLSSHRFHGISMRCCRSSWSSSSFSQDSILGPCVRVKRRRFRGMSAAFRAAALNRPKPTREER